MSPEAGKSYLRREAERRAEKMAAANPPTPEPVPDVDDEETEETYTLAELRKDKRFTTMLEVASAKDPKIGEVMARLETEKDTPEDQKALLAWRGEFLKRLDRVTDLHRDLEARFAGLKDSSEDLDELCKLYGTETFRSVLNSGLEELVFRDEKEFKKVEAKFKKLAQHEEAMRASQAAIDDPNSALNKPITDFCAKYKVSEDALFKVMGDPNVRNRGFELQNMMRQQMGWFEAVRDNYREFRKRPSSLDAAQQMAREATTHETVLADHDKLVELRAELIEKAGGFISGLVTKNDEIRRAMRRASAGETTPFKEGIASRMTVNELKQKISENPAKDVGTFFHNWLDERGMHFPDDPTDPARDSIRNQAYKAYVNEKCKGFTGLLSIMLRYLLGTKERDIKARMN